MRRFGTTELNNQHVARGHFKTCMVIGCNNKHRTFGLCDHHYKVYKDINTPYKPKTVKLCGITGCERSHLAKGLCQKHYNDWFKIVRENKLPLN